MRIYLFIAAVAGGVTYLLTPLIRHIAIEIGAVGEVRARDVHTVPTPRMGGLGMLIGFTVAMLFASRIPFIEGLFAQSCCILFYLYIRSPVIYASLQIYEVLSRQSKLCELLLCLVYNNS